MPWKQKTRWLKEQPAGRQTERVTESKGGLKQRGIVCGYKAEKKATFIQTSQTPRNLTCEVASFPETQSDVSPRVQTAESMTSLTGASFVPASRDQSSSQEAVLILLQCAQKEFVSVLVFCLAFFCPPTVQYNSVFYSYYLFFCDEPLGFKQANLNPN